MDFSAVSLLSPNETKGLSVACENGGNSHWSREPIMHCNISIILCKQGLPQSTFGIINHTHYNTSQLEVKRHIHIELVKEIITVIVIELCKHCSRWCFVAIGWPMWTNRQWDCRKRKDLLDLPISSPGDCRRRLVAEVSLSVERHILTLKLDGNIFLRPSIKHNGEYILRMSVF